MKIKHIFLCGILFLSVSGYCFGETVFLMKKGYDIPSDLLKDLFLDVFKYIDINPSLQYREFESRLVNTDFFNRRVFCGYMNRVLKPLVKDFNDILHRLESLQKAVAQAKEQQKHIPIVMEKMSFLLDNIQEEFHKAYSGAYYTEEKIAAFEDTVVAFEGEYTHLVEGLALALKDDQAKVDDYARIVMHLQREVDELSAELEICKIKHPTEKSKIDVIESNIFAVKNDMSTMQELISEAQVGIQQCDVTEKQKELILHIGSFGNQIGLMFENVLKEYKELTNNIAESQKQKELEEEKRQERERRKQERRKRRRNRRDVEIATKDVFDEEINEKFDFLDVYPDEVKLTKILQVAWELEQKLV